MEGTYKGYTLRTVWHEAEPDETRTSTWLGRTETYVHQGRKAHWSADAVDERGPITVVGWADSEAEAIQQARKVIDRWLADNAIRPKAQAALSPIHSPVVEPAAAGVGDYIVVQARGHRRVGVVEAIAKTGTLTVAVVTPTNPDLVTRVKVKP